MCLPEHNKHWRTSRGELKERTIYFVADQVFRSLRAISEDIPACERKKSLKGFVKRFVMARRYQAELQALSNRLLQADSDFCRTLIINTTGSTERIERLLVEEVMSALPHHSEGEPKGEPSNAQHETQQTNVTYIFSLFTSAAHDRQGAATGNGRWHGLLLGSLPGQDKVMSEARRWIARDVSY
ncbi:hypothetical protein K488DRAFT_68598 [Vararia minispora EC-137]|uniref:Uncharacterized protein n=1 Tax=Vararia minispora EC-137 TaxID=1314806 RepID=A0ACB8QU40_9AGAM|nr:hypothetical protein K488DRAFT_68598 [Vararia minispora EC-137]